MLAITLLKQACTMRYGKFASKLRNVFLKGIDQYPTNVTAAYEMLKNWHKGSRTEETVPLMDRVA